MRKAIRILGVLVISLALPLVIPAVSPAIQLDPIADSYVVSTDGDGNYGGTRGLYVRATAVKTINSYLKFDLTQAVNPSSNVSALKLHLYVASNTQAGQVQASQVADNWTETGITWNNAPAASVLLDTQAVPAGAGWVEWDLLAANGDSWLAGDLLDGTLSIMLQIAQSPGAGLPYFASESYRDASLQPYLEIVHLPLPPSALLLGSGLLGMMITVSRRKKIY